METNNSKESEFNDSEDSDQPPIKQIIPPKKLKPTSIELKHNN